MASLQREYGAKADPFDLWEAHIAGRDYAGAAALLDALQTAELPLDAWRFMGVPGIDLARIITDRFLNAQEPPAARLAAARARFEPEQGSGVIYFDANRYLAMAAATSTAVERLQSGLAEPSQVIPFIEPFLPYYDSLRNDPGFVEFLAGIQGEYREPLAEQTKVGRATSADPGRGPAR